ncbi:WASH complex subunit 3 [Tachysurus fulvidraco]|uniref:WASH complex subunit 3 n=1 Tax=Tachysurus fulvidraco TaxID=1234273 RepID=UPI000F50A4C9|nr:WASH complex subunit 3 [Tachysurus fulvidraco]
MDEDGLPIVGSGIDLTKVPAIQQRRIVTFLNQFIVHTVRFLNRFSTVCEEKLSAISLRIQQIETTLSILETKLSSIPGLEDVTVDRVDRRPSAETNGPAVVSSAPAGSTAPSPPSEVPGQGQEGSRGPKGESAADNMMTVAKDPRYARYLKMVQVGVPVMAIKNKMILEGLDPNLLDSPDAPVPDFSKKGTEERENDSSDSESSFSD